MIHLIFVQYMKHRMGIWLDYILREVYATKVQQATSSLSEGDSSN